VLIESVELRKMPSNAFAEMMLRCSRDGVVGPPSTTT